MRRLIRTVAVTFAGLALSAALPASPAGADGKCVDVYVYVTNPPSGATVCTPDL